MTRDQELPAPSPEPRAARLPRAVRRGPPITLKCDCGERHDVRYGERWTCEGCGRTWDTNQIPLEEYAAVLRTQVRYRALPVAFGLLLLAGVIAFVVAGRAFGIFIVVPFALAGWNMFVRPLHRRRFRKTLAENLPSWQIKPE